MKYCKPIKAPYRTSEHKAKRVEFAKARLSWESINWRKVVFTEEKKVSLHGPTGFARIGMTYGKHQKSMQLCLVKGNMNS